MGCEICEIHSTNVLCDTYNAVFIVLSTSSHEHLLWRSDDKIWHNVGLYYNLEYFTTSHNDGKVLQRDIQRLCTLARYGEESLPQLTKEDVELSQEQKTRKDWTTENWKEEKKPERMTTKKKQKKEEQQKKILKAFR